MSIQTMIYCTMAIVIVSAIIGSIGWYLYLKARAKYEDR